jgi:lipopolysaccharide/colanic/teichoic acid biosynthesis glycosyltransferase
MSPFTGTVAANEFVLEPARTYSHPSRRTLEERWPARPAPETARAEHMRRVINVVVAGLGLIVAVPVMLVIAVLVKLSSPGPVIFGQKRVGIDRRRPGDDGQGRRVFDCGGRLFTMYKFRTMRVQADSAPQIWASNRDPRITAVGHLLRKIRLDELPQLWNVLRGDMNLVGPRPEQPDIFVRIRDELDGYAHRQRVLPGVTGLAQIKLPYDSSIEDVRRKLELDLHYVSLKSPLQDLSIMARTIPVMLLRKGSR